MLFAILVLVVARLLVRFFKFLPPVHHHHYKFLYVWDVVVLSDVDATAGADQQR